MFGFLSVLYLLFILGVFGLSIYCMILFIKLARRGIEALDIYIVDKNNEKSKKEFEKLNNENKE